MTTTEMPPSPMACPWCRGGISASDTVCPDCFMPVNGTASTKVVAETKPAKTPAKRKPKILTDADNAKLDYKSLIQASREAGNPVVVGIDPGARYIGFSVRNKDDVFVSSTFKRPDSIPDSVDWAKKVVERIRDVLVDIEYDDMGIEGVTDPTGFKGGKQDALNPRDIIRTGVVVGALAITYPDAHIIRPRGNGDKPEEFYPSSLFGVRPKNLAGTKDEGVPTRKHERSAYDVAGHVIFELNQRKQST